MATTPHLLRAPLLALAALFVSCAERGSEKPAQGKKSPAPEVAFWEWFGANSEEFLGIFGSEALQAKEGDPALQAINEQAVQEITVKLKEVNSGFSPFLGGPLDQVERNFIVTAMGDWRLFDSIDRFVDSAPALEGWNIIALKPPLEPSDDWVISTGSVEIALAESKFEASRTPADRFDLVVYLVEGVDQSTPRAAGLAGNLALDFLGERLGGNVLGEVTVEDLKLAPAEAKPFLEIKPVLEKLHAKFMERPRAIRLRSGGGTPQGQGGLN